MGFGRLCSKCDVELADNEKRVCFECQHDTLIEARERWKKANPDLVAMSRVEFLKRNPNYNQRKVAEYRQRQKMKPILALLKSWPKGLTRKDVLEVLCFRCLRRLHDEIEARGKIQKEQSA